MNKPRPPMPHRPGFADDGGFCQPTKAGMKLWLPGLVVVLAQWLPSAALAQENALAQASSFTESESSSPGLSFQIVEAAKNEDEQGEPPLPGTLLLPDDQVQDGREKQCMTVCARWGEDCMLINKGGGGLERKCRRTCKQFAEECF